jgi:hypothetical protein
MAQNPEICTKDGGYGAITGVIYRDGQKFPVLGLGASLQKRATPALLNTAGNSLISAHASKRGVNA